jgi:hypothetical protein
MGANMKTKLLGLIASMVLLGVSEASAATLVGTTTDASGIDGLVVDGATYDVTFISASYDTVYASIAPSFLGENATASDAATALANALNTFAVTETTNSTFGLQIPYFDSPGFEDFSDEAFNYDHAVSSADWGALDGNPNSDSIDYSYEAFVVFSATPLPSALPLFAGGLGALSLFGWRRKRKNTGAIATA